MEYPTKYIMSMQLRCLPNNLQLNYPLGKYNNNKNSHY